MTLALLVLGVAGALGPRVTLARADTVTVTIADADGTAVPAAGVLSIATVTGQGDGGRSLMTKYRLSGGAGCAGSAAEDTGALLFSLPLFTDDAFTATQTVVIGDPGPSSSARGSRAGLRMVRDADLTDHRGAPDRRNRHDHGGSCER